MCSLQCSLHKVIKEEQTRVVPDSRITQHLSRPDPRPGLQACFEDLYVILESTTDTCFQTEFLLANRDVSGVAFK